MLIRRMAMLLAAGALAVGLSTAAVGPAQAVVAPSTDWNEIFSAFDHNFNNTLCVDDPSGNHSVGTQLWVWHCNSNPNQRWRFVFVAEDISGAAEFDIQLRSTVGTSMPLCITDNGTAGQRLTLTQCEGFNDTFWVMDAAPGTNPLMGLEDRFNGLCMAVADFSDNNGTPLISKTCDSNSSDLSMTWTLG
jgi:hypothetical protein